MRKNYLLNIAIDKYENSAFTPLNNAINDAKNLEKILVEKYDFENISKSLFNSDASRKNILESLNDLANLTTKDDNLIIHFAGHGSIHPKTRRGFWIPQDAKNSISDYIPNSSIIDSISGIDAKHIFLIIDSCFSGSFLSNSRSNNDFHYSKLDKFQSRWVLTSGREEKVSDGQPGSGSPFSIILNEFLDQNSDKSFSTTELAIAVSKGTGSISKQQPVFAHIENVGHKDGQMVFNFSKSSNTLPGLTENSDFSSIVITYSSAIKIEKIGITQKSIFSYYKKGNSIVLKKYDSKEDFICSAFTYEEIIQHIPEHIKVDKNTYLARFDGYDKLGQTEQGNYDFAIINFQRTEMKKTPYMAVCTCRGRMVAFSISEDGKYNNLICWGVNQAESAAKMILELSRENKL